MLTKILHEIKGQIFELKYVKLDENELKLYLAKHTWQN